MCSRFSGFSSVLSRKDLSYESNTLQLPGISQGQLKLGGGEGGVSPRFSVNSDVNSSIMGDICTLSEIKR
ncbi:hypothetical protein Fmac_010961 [Flemingia macrophylla]|uniref:Uncharacterized protein n=1 Tax=Flemingia macrophylla TaxID=520843 RepID=A0ABD1MN61_9FABA